jgi:hypothetical protein
MVAAADFCPAQRTFIVRSENFSGGSFFKIVS